MLIFSACSCAQRFDGDAPAQHDIFGQVDNTHSTFAEFADNAIVGNELVPIKIWDSQVSKWKAE